VTVRAVVFRAPGLVETTDVTDPVIEHPDDAIVRVTRAGICGSDLHFFHLKAPIDPGEVLGHEAVGIVESVGSAVRSFRVRDRVVVAFHIACGACWFCRHGETSLCEEFRNLGAGAFSGGLAGAQAERVRVPVADVNLLAVPESVDDERALFAGDVLSTGLYAASLAAPTPEETVAVVGVGPVGYCTIQALRATSDARVVAIEREPARLALGESAGATAIDATARNPEMALAAMTEDRGADVVIEAVGHPAAFGSALEIVRRGGRVVVVGMYAGEVVDIALGVFWARALTLRFTGVCPVHAWWDRAMKLLADGLVDPLPVVSHRVSLEDAWSAYALFDRQEATKVLLIP
jgi:threonine dehydrogenase-like Zn-dependent dehydrogenase